MRKEILVSTEIHCFLRMRLVFEYRIPMPLSVEEQRVGLRFMLLEAMYRCYFLT